MTSGLVIFPSLLTIQMEKRKCCIKNNFF